MKRTLLFAALFASGLAAAQGFDRYPASSTIAATPVTLPSNVVADRANVSADFSAVAAAKAALTTAVAAGDASAVQAAATAYQAARIKLDTDMRTLRTDAQPIVTQDEANLGDDRILIEIYTLTNNTTALATARTQLETDRAQAAANGKAIFGDLCPSGVTCDIGHPFGPGFGPPPMHPHDAAMRGR
jgi:hypothetical protein